MLVLVGHSCAQVGLEPYESGYDSNTASHCSKEKCGMANSSCMFPSPDIVATSVVTDGT